MEEILKEVQNGTLSIEDAKKKLATYEDLGFAKVDHHRKQRQGFPEVIYGEGKTVEQIIAILQAIKAKQNDILITRISPDKADKILGVHPELTYHDMAQILSLKVEEKREKKKDISLFSVPEPLTCGSLKKQPLLLKHWAVMYADFMMSELLEFTGY